MKRDESTQNKYVYNLIIIFSYKKIYFYIKYAYLQVFIQLYVTVNNLYIFLLKIYIKYNKIIYL